MKKLHNFLLEFSGLFLGAGIGGLFWHNIGVWFMIPLAIGIFYSVLYWEKYFFNTQR